MDEVSKDGCGDLSADAREGCFDIVDLGVGYELLVVDSEVFVFVRRVALAVV